jgi:hypothetical protein
MMVIYNIYHMGRKVKVQVNIKMDQYFVTVPKTIVEMMDIKKGQEVSWMLHPTDRKALILSVEE